MKRGAGNATSPVNQSIVVVSPFLRLLKALTQIGDVRAELNS
jgi:hypothetical protein